MVALVLVVLLAGLLSSPDVPPVTVATWAKVAPADFIATAASELAGTSETATYGPPYNHATGNVQRILLLLADPGRGAPADRRGRRPSSSRRSQARARPIPPSPARSTATSRLGPSQQRAWANAYSTAVTHVSFRRRPRRSSPGARRPGAGHARDRADPGPHRGALDADLLAQHPFYGTDFTKPLLFLEDGSYFSNLASADHLTGAQWGVMNETGSYPGQPWLWLYTLWYQVPGFDSSANVDLIAIYLTGVATVAPPGGPLHPGAA